MKFFLVLVSIIAIVLAYFCFMPESYEKISDETLPVPMIGYSPESYVCYKAPEQLQIDGKLDEQAWKDASWTNEFVDIEGDLKPKPTLATQAKMLWDDNYFYFAARMEEPHLWSTLTERDAVIYHDNDFEVFIDPDGDTHEYYELEVNLLGTEWDLFLGKPYRDGGPAIHSWDIQGLKTAVHLNGTINDPTDTDNGWSIEIAIPWKVLKECAHVDTPPKDADQWRVNFSRVEWDLEAIDGKYSKIINPETGKPMPEHNWVWSPQGLIAMHYPEMWGVVQFSGKAPGKSEVQFRENHDEPTRWALRQLYYAERTHQMQYGCYTDDLDRLNLVDTSINPEIECTSSQFTAWVELLKAGKRLCISQDGDIWQESLSVKR